MCGNSTISSNLMNFRKGIMHDSPQELIKSNDEISHENFLKTGDNQIFECLNLADHMTNFVDHDASLDFLQFSNLHNLGLLSSEAQQH